jgi:hypothetical protein
MYAVTMPEQSAGVLEEIVDVQCGIFDSLQLHCR